MGALGLKLDLSQLHPFARWLPSLHLTRIFDTRFYIAREMYPEAKGVLDVSLAEDRTMEDVTGSVMRELEEETGLTAADCRADADWHCIYTGVALAMMQILRVDMPADTLRALPARDIPFGATDTRRR